MRSAVVCVCLVLCAVLGRGLGARILVVLPFPGTSHVIFSSSVIRALTNRGHQVVEYSPYPPTKQTANHTHVEIRTRFEDMIEDWTYETFVKVSEEDRHFPRFGFRVIWQMLYPICKKAFKDENIQKLLKSNEHFDLVITESTFGQESLLVLGHRFKAPIITLQAFNLWNVLNRAAGNALSIASIPDFISTAFTDHMTFTERTINFLSTIITLFKFHNSHFPIHQKIINENYPGEAPAIIDLVTNVSLYIVNAHPAVEYSQPYTPNIVPVAGICITQERLPLPKDIQKFMDEAKEGVIYFSFGTVVPLHLFPQEILQVFVNVFKKLNYKVIWKIDLEDIPGLPKNVILRKWLPQPGILAHPNCAVFFTHGGLNSQLEAIAAGVPTVAMPFFGDQMYNVRFNEARNIGLKLDFHTLSEETLTSALITVLKTPSYKENARKMSRIFRDQPVSPADSVVFWTEYVLRHGGARHLQPAAAHLSWYQLSLLDVASVVLMALAAVIITIYVVVSSILSKVLRWSSRKDVTSSKKKD